MDINLLQLQASLSLITDLQLRTENPTQYETYENHKKKLQELINQQSAHSLQSAASINVALGRSRSNALAIPEDKPSRPFGPAGDWKLAPARSR